MTFHDLDDPVGWTPGAAFRERVTAGGRRRKLRRRVTGTGSALAVLLLVVGGMAVALRSNGEPATTRIATDPAPTTPTTAVPAETSLPAVSTAVPTSAPAEIAPKSTTTSTTVAAQQCSSSDFRLGATAEQASYNRGERVGLTLTAENVSGRRCYAPTFGDYEVLDSNGNVVESGSVHSDNDSYPIVEPGATTAFNVTWGGNVCNEDGCQPAPAGTYRARLVASVGSARTPPFSLT